MLETLPHPIDPEAIDLLLHVGKDNYTLPRYMREAHRWGISKRLSATSIPSPEKIKPGYSRIFLWFDEVIPVVQMPGCTLADLTAHLIELGLLAFDTAKALDLDEAWVPEEHLLPSSYVPPHICRIACIIQDQKPKLRREIEEKFMICWQGAIFMWAYCGRLQFIVGEGKQPPEDVVSRYGDSIDYISVDYDRSWKDEPEFRKQEGE